MDSPEEDLTGLNSYLKSPERKRALYERLERAREDEKYGATPYIRYLGKLSIKLFTELLDKCPST